MEKDNPQRFSHVDGVPSHIALGIALIALVAPFAGEIDQSDARSQNSCYELLDREYGRHAPKDFDIVISSDSRGGWIAHPLNNIRVLCKETPANKFKVILIEENCDRYKMPLENHWINAFQINTIRASSLGALMIYKSGKSLKRGQKIEHKEMVEIPLESLRQCRNDLGAAQYKKEK